MHCKVWLALQTQRYNSGDYKQAAEDAMRAWLRVQTAAACHENGQVILISFPLAPVTLTRTLLSLFLFLEWNASKLSASAFAAADTRTCMRITTLSWLPIRLKIPAH